MSNSRGALYLQRTNFKYSSQGISQLETFASPKDLVENPQYLKQRQESLRALDVETLDVPIIGVVKGFAQLPYCFLLQSCYGHFLHNFQKDPYNTTPLPVQGCISRVEFRIAYLALCIENSKSGKDLFHDLSLIPASDPDCIQFGSADWFWNRQVNSYALQVEPLRYLMRDKITVDFREALHIEKVRNRFFADLNKLLKIRLRLIIDH